MQSNAYAFVGYGVSRSHIMPSCLLTSFLSGSVISVDSAGAPGGSLAYRLYIGQVYAIQTIVMNMCVTSNVLIIYCNTTWILSDGELGLRT